MASTRGNKENILHQKGKKVSSKCEQIDTRRVKRYSKRKSKPRKEQEHAASSENVTKSRLTVPRLSMKKGLFLRGKGTSFFSRGKKGIPLNVLNQARLKGKLHDILSLAGGSEESLPDRREELPDSPIRIIETHCTPKSQHEEVFEDVLSSSKQPTPSTEEDHINEEEEYEELLEFVEEITFEKHLNKVVKSDYIDDIRRNLRAIYIESSKHKREASPEEFPVIDLHNEPVLEVRDEAVQCCSLDVPKATDEIIQTELSPVSIAAEESIDSDNDIRIPLSSSDSNISLSDLDPLEVLKKHSQRSVEDIQLPEFDSSSSDSEPCSSCLDPFEVLKKQFEENMEDIELPEFNIRSAREQRIPAYRQEVFSDPCVIPEAYAVDEFRHPVSAPRWKSRKSRRMELLTRIPDNNVRIGARKSSDIPTPVVKQIFNSARNMY